MLPRLSVTAATGRTHSTYVTSVVAWLDTDDDERRRMRELITMFRDQGAVDELGMKALFTAALRDFSGGGAASRLPGRAEARREGGAA